MFKRNFKNNWTRTKIDSKRSCRAPKTKRTKNFTSINDIFDTFITNKHTKDMKVVFQARCVKKEIIFVNSE